MTKKEKRKKVQPEKTEIEVNDPAKETLKNDDYSKSKSRSRSRGRRSLSSIFRKPSSRTESIDRSNLLEDAGQEPVSDINPRINPRDHLKRMTVREALVYDRRRGRSPSRRTRKLEKKILQNEARLSNDNLSISLPHLDQLSEDQSQVPAASFISYDARGGSTLPRIKKRRGNSEGRDAQNIRQSVLQSSNISSINKPVQILPLDKRKYLINRDNNIDETDSININIPHDIKFSTNETHSNKNKNTIPVEKSEDKRRRLETHNTFLSLRDKKSAHAHSHLALDTSCDALVDAKPDSTALNTSQSIPFTSIQTGKSLEREVINGQSSNNHNDKTDKTQSCGSSEHVSPVVANTEASAIPASTTKVEKKRRSSYISPRRFSRTSRTSVTSNISETSIRSLPSDNKPLHSTEPLRVPVRYHRHFSRENKKEKYVSEERNEKKNNHQQMIDASTSMDKIPLLTETHNNQHTSSFVHNPDIENIETDAVFEPDETAIKVNIDEDIHQAIENENEMLKENNSTTESADDNCDILKSAPSLQREVIVIDKNAEPNIQTCDHESAFRPIRSDSDLYAQDIANAENNKNNKFQHVGFDIGEIEVLSSDIMIENEHDDDSSTISDQKAQKEAKKTKHEAEGMSKMKEKEHEKADKDKKSWSGKSRKEKRKSKKKLEKGKHKKENDCNSKSIECIESENLQSKEEIVTHDDSNKKVKDDGKPKCSKIKKRKSILKKRSKDKDNKSIKDSIKPITRTASLSHFIDECEETERRKSVSICEKRSRSLDDINKSTNSEQMVKEEENKVPEKTHKPEQKSSNDNELKDVKQPKLSIAAIVAIRAKISRMKRAKQEQAKNNACNENNESELKIVEISPPTDQHESSENTDMSVAKVFYENEINTSLGKSDNSISLIEDADKEVKDLVYDKRISFSPYCDDTISEEEMIKQRQRNTRLTSRRESKVRQRQKKVINCCKKGIAFLFSHIGLCSLVVGYCILGGIIFKALEGDNEIEQKKEIKELRQNFTDKIYRLAFEQTLTKGNRDIFINEVNLILKNFSVMIHKQTKEAGWDGKEVKMTMNTDGEESMEPEPEQWSYPSSLLYAITVMTTIGKILYPSYI